MTIQTLQQELDAAIAAENYEDAHRIKLLMDAPRPTETLYQDAEGYQRGAPEQFAGTHDTVAQRWEYQGVLRSADDIKSEVLAAFPHEVEKVQLLRPSGQPSQFHSLEYGGEELRTSVKSGYVPHTREHLVQLCDAARDAFDGQVKIATAWKDAHYISVQPTDKDRRAVFASTGDDGINPRFIIKAGCGGSGYNASLGWYRDVCNNLTWLKSVAVVSANIRHSASLSDRHDELVEQFQTVAQGWEQTVTLLAEMEQRQVAVSALLLQLMGERPEDKGSRQTRYDNKVKAIDGILVRERQKLNKPKRPATEATAWELFNAVQGYAQHEKSRKGLSKCSSDQVYMQRAIMANNDAEVAKAESLLFAEELNERLVLA